MRPYKNLWLRGRFWWVSYNVNGRNVRESTKTENLTEAKRFLAKRKGQVAVGQPIVPRADRVRVEELLADLRMHYETTGSRGLREADTRLKPLKAFFTGRRAAALNGADFDSYAKARQAQGRAAATVNLELAVLGRAMRLGLENEKILRIPVIHPLKVSNTRQGFFEPEQFEAVRKRLPDDLKVAVTIMHTYGWRLGEVVGLRLSQVDLKVGTLRLEPGTTKNRQGRAVYMTPELKDMLAAQVGRVTQLSRQLNRVIPYLFTYSHGRLAGTQRKDFRRAWKSAVRAVGLPGMLKHDFRRTAVRNMERTGVPRSVAMKLTGHKTESVYRRYAIVSDADLKEATRRLSVTISGTMATPAIDIGL